MNANNIDYDEGFNGMCINKVPIFSDLSINESLEISKATINSHYKKGDIIFSSGEVSKNLTIIHKGRVKIYRVSEAGKEQILRVLTSGDFFGELSLFNNSISYSNIEALEETEVCIVEGEKLKELILKVPNIAMKILKEFSRRLANSDEQIEYLGTQDVEQRIMKILLQLAEGKKRNNNMVDILLPMSKKDLASYVGTTQETLSRKLSSLQEKGLIKLLGQRKIIIIDEQKLRSSL